MTDAAAGRPGRWVCRWSAAGSATDSPGPRSRRRQSLDGNTAVYVWSESHHPDTVWQRCLVCFRTVRYDSVVSHSTLPSCCIVSPKCATIRLLDCSAVICVFYTSHSATHRPSYTYPLNPAASYPHCTLLYSYASFPILPLGVLPHWTPQRLSPLRSKHYRCYVIAETGVRAGGVSSRQLRRPTGLPANYRRWRRCGGSFARVAVRHCRVVWSLGTVAWYGRSVLSPVSVARHCRLV